MSFFRSLRLLPLFLLVGFARVPERLHLVVLHTGDVHGQVLGRPATWVRAEDPPLAGGLPRLAAKVRELRAEAEASGAGVLVLDAGDWFQGTPEGNLEQGRPFLAAMKGVGYDALCVGNHEWDHGIAVLEGHIAALELPALLANVTRREDGMHVAGTAGSATFVRAGLRVQVIGLLSTTTPEITHADAKGYEFAGPATALDRERGLVAGIVDVTIALTHLGLTADRQLAREVPDLDLIIGGHSHTFLKEGVREGGALIAHMGSKASGLGRVDLWFDTETRKVVEARAQVVDLLVEPEPQHRVAAVDEACRALVARTAAHMDEVVGELTAPLMRSRERFASGTAGNLLTDVFRAAMRGDVALHNRGGIRTDLRAGPVTRRDLFDLQPFGNTLVVLELTGIELNAVVRRAVEGGGHTGLEFSGMIVVVREGEEGARLERILVGGEALDAQRSYRVVTNSFLAGGGDGYVELSERTPTERNLSPLRDLLEAHFREQGKVALPTENRYRTFD